MSNIPGTLCILWLICLVSSIINCATGGEPTWFSVIIAQALLVMLYFCDWAEKHIK